VAEAAIFLQPQKMGRGFRHFTKFKVIHFTKNFLTFIAIGMHECIKNSRNMFVAIKIFGEMCNRRPGSRFFATRKKPRPFSTPAVNGGGAVNKHLG
jgi:hypothetical protein